MMEREKIIQITKLSKKRLKILFTVIVVLKILKFANCTSREATLNDELENF